MHLYEKKFMAQTNYRISFTIRNDSEHNLISERVMAEGINDIDELSRKFLRVLKAFNNKKPEEIYKAPDSNFYVEIFEVSNETIREIAFATVLRYS